ncbi:hypothetical protein TRFO_14495 [Tritrichomonas foetus]|uniref:Peptidase S8/S53 domain-containing protein n=1 Tax=Tritrichomonas foetus TaxID=1144522 RepID=A0A1J4KVU4_9EUKA|nr:hypothetical protein TRFO_14495 [Tritrichomonas foetus]|eukprot:OHT15008.1 hypothetical protein TRFO_14495 [Tritrichomonas foetus]
MFLICLLTYFDVNGLLNSNQNDFGFATMRGNKRINFNNEKLLFRRFKQMNKEKQRSQLKRETDVEVGREDISEREWCYVKFNESLKNKEKHEILSKINIKADSLNLLTNSVYQLYLTHKQIDYLIENNVLIHLFQPEDKISIRRFSNEKGDRNIQARQYNHNEHYKYSIIVHETYTLPTNENLYQILARNSKTSYIVSISLDKIKESIIFLSKLTGVSLIFDHVELTASNQFGAGFSQKNDQPIHIEKQQIPRYINDHGITGKNEVITIIDTLIDFHHSHFYDEKMNVTFNTLMPDHRKMIYYKYDGTHKEYSQNLESNEHGTHVAGIAAGKNACPDEKLQILNGNAPDAKIAYAGHYNDYDIMENLQKIMDLTNSKISSNSWGTVGTSVVVAYDFNQFTNKNQDKIFIASAANNGRKYDNFCVSDPGGSKNVLTIGALQSLFSKENTYSMRLADNHSHIISLMSVSGYIRSFKGNINELTPIDTEKDTDFCHIINLDTDVILYSNNMSKTYNDLRMKCLPNKDRDFASIFITRKSDILPFLNQNVELYHDTIINIQYFYMKADYSSTGPTIKGIVKPDVMTPGTAIYSAKSISKSLKDHGCDIHKDYIYMGGTSMATPNAAGAAALIRQYFVEGNWLNTKISLNGIQLRGLMISSSSNFKMQDVSDEEQIVNYRTGFGAIDLSTILSFNNKEFGVAMTKTEGNKIESQSHYRTKIKITKSKYSMKRLSFVLTYLDLETNYDSIIPLLNDLDLVVISPSGKRYLGNDNNYKKQDLHNKAASYLSTNERVLLSNEEIEDGEYIIDIYSNELFNDESIDFSLIVVGPVDDQYIEFNPTQECDCYLSDNHSIDSSSDGHCKCDKNHIGNHCQIEISEIENKVDTKFNITVGASEIKYFYLNNGKIGTIYVTREHNMSEYASIWVGKECSQHLSTFERNNWIKSDDFSINIGYDSPVCVALFNNYPSQQTFELLVSEEYHNESALLIGIIIGLVVVIVAIILSIWLCCAFCSCCVDISETICCGICACCHRRRNNANSASASNQICQVSIQT